LPPPLFRSFSRPAQLFVAAVAPLCLGFSSGAVIGASATIFLCLQAVAVAGGLWAGLEHATLSGSAARGALGGLAFGAALLAGYQAFGGPDHGLLPELRPVQIVITTAFGTLLGLAGARLRGRWLEPRSRTGALP
jgi:hypothetical protein